jgi:tetratricopeptide (TPR) repeat protein
LNYKLSYKFFRSIAIIIALGLLFSCSTKKNSFTRRVYHNLTCHYNGYWNGNEKFKQGIRELEKNSKYNFHKVLPVTNYGAKEDASSLNQYMDIAIKKASIMIQRHSLYFHKKEYNRWIDDCYMLIGKSYFYKKEFPNARRTFKFIINDYDKEPVKYEAMLWLARTFIQMEEYEKAQSYLDLIKSKMGKDDMPNSVIKDFPLVYANFYILQEKFSSSMEYLYDGIDLNTKKQLITRLKFILAQIYQKENDLTEASILYKEVFKRNPDYDLAFQAKLNLAKCFESGSGNSKLIVKTLNKMLKDPKNKDYRDQIYYALAEVELKVHNDTLAINYLALSVATSVNNNFQKASSALTLADLYFKIPEYENSQAYYDTAMQFLPEDYPNYETIEAKTKILSEIVENLIIIQLEDSLQNLAAMSEEDRNVIIDKLIAQVALEEQKRLEEELRMQQEQSFARTNDFSRREGQKSGAWYFYNPTTLSFGLTEFNKKWGRRKLEDLWFLSNKRVISFGEDEELMPLDSLSSDSTIVVSTDPLKRETYLQYIPLTEEQVIASDKKIANSYFQLGKLYDHGLEDFFEAINSYEKLLDKYPENDFLLQSYYNLYKLYEKIGNQSKMDFYKNLIIEKFPDSDYAKILIDPNYYKELEAEKNKALVLYDETYSAYKDGDYYLVINNTDDAFTLYNEPKEILAKFKYLKALSIGKVDIVDSLTSQLKQLIDTFPNTEVTPLAQDLLEYILGPQITEEDISQEEKQANELYTYDPEETHLFVLIVNGMEVNINAVKVRISDFDSKHFSLKDLTINSILLDQEHHIITVGNFENSEDALIYYNAIRKDTYIFSNLLTDNYSSFVVSTTSYPVFYKSKDIAVYELFFKREYLKEEPQTEQ